jgi:hypothetical protein
MYEWTRISDLILSHICGCVTIDGVWICWQLVPQDSELEVITLPPLISTIHKWPQHLLSLFQPAVSSPFIPLQLLLRVEILQLPMLRSFLHWLQYRTACQLSLSGTLLTLFITFWHEPHRKRRFHCYSPTIPRLLLVYSLPQERAYQAVA